MKTFSTHLVRNVLAFVVVTSIAYGMYLSSPSTFDASKVEAGAGQNVSGWAWSEGTGSGLADNPAGPYTAGSNPGVGWISFNSSDCDTDKNGKTDIGACGGNNTTTVATDYGVDVNPIASTGLGIFSGNAWAPNDPDSSGNPTGIGWISFNRTTTGTPTFAWGDPGLAKPGTPLAYVEWTTGKVYGWARAIVACKDTSWNGASCTSPNAGDKAGGWDGWIKLSGTATDGSVYGVVINSDGTFSGKAWGGDVIGWIDFAQVHLPIPCTAANPTYFEGSCTALGQCHGPSVTQIVPGVKIVACSDGSIPVSPTVACTVSQTCTAIAGSPICGDNQCNFGETFGTCPADCKIKTKFQQF